MTLTIYFALFVPFYNFWAFFLVEKQTDWFLSISESPLFPEKLDCLWEHLRHGSWTVLSEQENGENGKKGVLDHLHGTQHNRWSHGDSSVSLLLVKKNRRHILQSCIFSISKHGNNLPFSIKGNHIISFFYALLLYFHLTAFLKNDRVKTKVRRDQPA